MDDTTETPPTPPQLGHIDRFAGQYSFLSNFYPTTILIEDISYPTAEHAFQAAKTTNPTTRNTIARAATPGQAKQLGRQRLTTQGHPFLRSDWETVKNQVMLEIITTKFTEPHLRDQLIATGERQLIEGNQWGDRYWGTKTTRNQTSIG